MRTKIAVIGLGNIGYSLLTGLLRSGYAANQVWGCDTNDTMVKRAKQLGDIKAFNDYRKYISKANVIFFCVRSDQVYPLVKQMSPHLNSSQTLICLSAGIENQELVKNLKPAKCKVVRAVSNINLAGACAYTVVLANKGKVNINAIEIFEAVGKVLVVNSEHKLDTISLLSGCSPPLIATFVESLVRSGVEVGINSELATEIVKQVMCATLQTMENANMSTLDIKSRSSTPGGFVIKALDRLHRRHFEPAIEEWLPSIMNDFHNINKKEIELDH